MDGTSGSSSLSAEGHVARSAKKRKKAMKAHEIITNLQKTTG